MIIKAPSSLLGSWCFGFERMLMNYLISAAIITMIIPIWGLIIHALNSMLFCMLKRITGTGFALFATNWLTFPGVIHHELSHAFFAVITGAKITEFRPFWPDKNTGSLGNIGFVARGNLLIRSVQLAFTTAGPVIMGTISSLFIIVLMKTRTFPIHMAFIKLLSAENPLALADGMKAVLLNQHLA